METENYLTLPILSARKVQKASGIGFLLRQEQNFKAQVEI